MLESTHNLTPAMMRNTDRSNLGLSQESPRKEKAQGEQAAVFKMKKGERMGGSVPVWEAPSNEKEKVVQRLNMAEKNSFESQISTSAFAQNEESIAGSDHQGRPFGFGDIFDMVNPLHHIPVVGNLYREATGDEIRGISKIMGGAVFGGALGAAGSVANVAVENETGRDVLGNIQYSLRSPSIAASSPEMNASPASSSLASRMNAISPGAMPQNEPARSVNSNEDQSASWKIEQMGRDYIANKAKSFLGASVSVMDLKMAGEQPMTSSRSVKDPDAPEASRPSPQDVAGLYQRAALQ